MGYNSFFRSPKTEEQQVPDTIVNEFSNSKDVYVEEEMDIMDELDSLESILGIEDDGKLARDDDNVYGQLSWDFMDLEEFQNGEEEEKTGKCFEDGGSYYGKVIKQENFGFWDEDDDGKVSLNLNLNYQEVLDAWSDRGSLWADHNSLSMPNNGHNYMGEVPVMEEERTRREASVLRYKEKRQSRLFSKKIRYQVRKLNADKRPRLKGRFVKRI